jgi:NAD(P)H-flavin reductase
MSTAPFLQLAAASRTSPSSATSTNQVDVATIAPYATSLNGVNLPLDNLSKDILWWSLGVLAMLVLGLRVQERFRAYLRHLAAMSVSGQQQIYWATNQSSWWKVKKHLIYAPLWRKRHNLEIKLSSAVNMGTLPSRLHALLLVAYLLSNIVFCVCLSYSDIDKYEVAAELRGRSGMLAVVNMVPLVILAGRNNPLIHLLQVSFDTYNLLHRWIGRMVVLEAIVHTIAWAYVKYAAAGWSGIGTKIVGDPFITWGTVSFIAMPVILLSSPSPVRHAFYETFLNVHIILAFIAVIGVLLHCKLGNLYQTAYIWAVLVLWLAERVTRMARILSCNLSHQTWTRASVEQLPGDACRVIMHLPKYMDINPGTHAYLRFATVNVWESHPFSIAWVDHISNMPISSSSEKDLESQGPRKIDKSSTATNVSFIIHAQTGLTRRLFDKASLCSLKVLSLRGAFEGPYGGHHSLDSYGHAVLFAGSSGITHQIPYLRHLIQGFASGTVATRKIILVWIIRDAEHLEWVRPWMDIILQMPRRRDILIIKIFVTRPKNAREIASPSATVQMSPGRPNVKLLLQNEVRGQVGAMVVTVCGPGGLADNVREAVREVQEDGVVDFIEESFTW